MIYWLIGIVLASLLTGLTAFVSYQAYHDVLLSKRGRIVFGSIFAVLSVLVAALSVFIAAYGG